ncbi:hypothetical protein [Teichococcus oryzae]|uniref:Roadblock/LC7 domain-containing protein n=1 Tax=Teichococcus oryzae TaxID=1608942 RepID=A0A5B2TAV9_9PROT|nr:hypothetical protein [Pseudoroseomonas oryzae]KAA2211667.1 hypothetical protein F0Q34_18980 [Pseudoroseomonas oryzae]
MSSETKVQSDHDPNHPLTRALRALVQKHGLRGAVLLTIDGDRIGINSSSPSPAFGAVMTALGDEILDRFFAGDFDNALLAAPSEGQA